MVPPNPSHGATRNFELIPYFPLPLTSTLNQWANEFSLFSLREVPKVSPLLSQTPPLPQFWPSVSPHDVSTASELVSALSSLPSSKFSPHYSKIYFLKTQIQWWHSPYGMRPSASLFVSSLIPTTTPKVILGSDPPTLLAEGSIPSHAFRVLLPILDPQNVFSPLLCLVSYSTVP